MTSHPWKRFHGPEGARQAGMPGGGGQDIGRLCVEADGAPYVPDHWSISWPTGRVPGRMRRQTPDGRALEAFVLFYEFVRASIARPSSHLPAKARCESRRGNDEARPAAGRARDRGPPVVRRPRGGQRAKRALGRERKENAGGTHISARQSHITTQV